MRRAVAVLLVLCVGLLVPASSSAITGSVVLAQDSSDPPALGIVVLQDTLTGTGPFRPRACPTGRSTSEFAEEGYRVRITGRCTDTNTSAFFVSAATGTSAANGEIAIDVKVAEGRDRGWVGISFRDQANGDGYFFAWTPAESRVELRKSIGSISAQLAENSNFADLDPDAWTRLAIRFAGPKIWAFVNDQLVLTVSDPSLTRGGFTIDSGRFGNVEDDAPVSVVWRNLQVTALASEPPPAGAPRPASSAPSPANGAPQAGSSAPASALPAASAPPSGPPPGVGEVVYQDPLTAPGIIPLGSCPTGKGRGEVVGEGFLMAVQGKCTAQARTAAVGPTLAGLTVSDGEIGFEFKVTHGVDRATITLVSRVKDGAPSGYAMSVAPASGFGLIARIGQDASSTALLARRADLGGLLHRDDWNTLAMRLVGSSLWLLINDQPALMAEDGTFDTGAVGLGIGKSGNADDEEEVAVVFRNFSVSKIDGAPEDRAPSYHRPSAPPDRGSTLSLVR